jgi:hypothetical protein
MSECYYTERATAAAAAMRNVHMHMPKTCGMLCVSHGNGLRGIPPQSVVLGRDNLAGTAPCGAVVDDDELVSCTVRDRIFQGKAGGGAAGGAIWESGVPLGGARKRE